MKYLFNLVKIGNTVHLDYQIGTKTKSEILKGEAKEFLQSSPQEHTRFIFYHICSSNAKVGYQ